MRVTRRSRVEEQMLEKAAEDVKPVTDVHKAAVEDVADRAKGIGDGWISRSQVYRDNYDRIFRK